MPDIEVVGKIGISYIVIVRRISNYNGTFLGMNCCCCIGLVRFSDVYIGRQSCHYSGNPFNMSKPILCCGTKRIRLRVVPNHRKGLTGENVGDFVAHVLPNCKFRTTV